MKIKEMKYGKERIIELLCNDKYKTYNYYILNLGTHPTAYVEIPKGHKLFGINYMDIEDSIDVHGGLTYSSNELMGIKSENWFIGWDYAHCNDYCGYEEDMPESIRTYGKKWTTEEIIEECKNVIDQIIDFESEEILEEQKKQVKPITKKDIEALGYACGEIQKCFTNGWNKSLENKPLEEQKKIPEKLDISHDGNHCYLQITKDIKSVLTDSEALVINKINSIIDYLKSKGDE